jgi:hypothetical protein
MAVEFLRALTFLYGPGCAGVFGKGFSTYKTHRDRKYWASLDNF